MGRHEKRTIQRGTRINNLLPYQFIVQIDALNAFNPVNEILDFFIFKYFVTVVITSQDNWSVFNPNNRVVASVLKSTRIQQY